MRHSAILLQIFGEQDDALTGLLLTPSSSAAINEEYPCRGRCWDLI